MTGIVKTDQIQGAGSSTVTVPTGHTLAVTSNATVGGTLGVTGDLTVDTDTLKVDTTNDKVGINTANPNDYYSDELVVTAADEGGMTLVTGTTHANYINFADGTAGNAAYRGFLKYDHNDDMMLLGTSAATAMVIDSIGNVGIGNSNPSSFGSLTDNLVIGTTSGENGMTIASGTANSGRLQFSDDGSFRGAIEYAHGSTDALLFYTAGTQQMRIRSDGQVAIGTTGGSAQLQVLKSSGDIVYFQNSGGTGAKLTAGNQSFSAVSDQNKKENITELDKQQSYDNIKNIRAVTYKFKDIEITDSDGKKTTHKDDKSRIGFIAQDWETKYSQLVDTDDDGIKSLLYTETTPVLLSALQKAQEKIETLEAKVTALESK
tara:strand:+ start:519 stop:1643 length:1125 start_codon:yes stop_codon:yes gene_type:complete